MSVVVGNGRFKQAILSALADKEMVRIIDCATLCQKSVSGIISETGISHSTAYRKIKWMLEEGLLFTEKIAITPDGKKFSLVRSTIKSIAINYDSGNTTVQIEYNINVLEKTTTRLFSIRPD